MKSACLLIFVVFTQAVEDSDPEADPEADPEEEDGGYQYKGQYILLLLQKLQLTDSDSIRGIDG